MITVLSVRVILIVQEIKSVLLTRALVATLRVRLAIPQEVVTVCLAHLASI
jgi:hypothetical protein